MNEAVNYSFVCLGVPGERMSSERDLHPIGIGCMRLSTERDRDDVAGIEILHAAFDVGITFLDTADAYCRDDSEVGHNERLIARALAPGAATALGSSSRRRAG